MKWLLFITWLVCYQPVNSQGNIETLVKDITAGSRTEKEKVTGIFYWITDHISYRTKNVNPSSIVSSNRLSTGEEDEEELSPLLPLNERIAEKVLAARLAVCDGYARLFKVLCDYAGIRSEIISGYANGNSFRPPSKFGVNHYWNVVFFENEWHLLDAAWASGYVTRQGGEFVREYNSHYFLTDPKLFIRDHYPDDPRWTLLPETFVPVEFRKSPFKQKSFRKYNITSIMPSKGVLDVELGDTIYFELETADAGKDRSIVPNLLVDSSLYSHSASWVFLHPVSTMITENRYRYMYKVEDANIDWLFLMYNQDIVLRYKVNVKTKKTDGSTASL